MNFHSFLNVSLMTHSILYSVLNVADGGRGRNQGLEFMTFSAGRILQYYFNETLMSQTF